MIIGLPQSAIFEVSRAVVQAAEEAAEEVALSGSVLVPVGFAPVVVISCAG